MSMRFCGCSFLAGLLVCLLLLAPPLHAAGEHAGRVTTATGVAVPGARVTAQQGDTRVTTTTDAQGVYRFPSLADGTWSVEIEMIGFAAQRREIVVSPEAPVATWQLAVQPFAEITRGATIAAPVVTRDAGQRVKAAPSSAETPAGGRAAGPGPGVGTAVPGALQRTTAGAPSPAAAAAAAAASGLPGGAPAGARPPGLPLPAATAGQAAGDSFLLSGSVNSGSAPQPSVGNVRRPTGVRLFNGTVSISGSNSAWDARPYSLTGLPVQRPDTSNVNFSISTGGPFRIPGLMRNMRNLTFTYSRTSGNDANTRSERMPTLQQRGGDFSGMIDGFGNAVQINDPLTGQPFPGNIIPPDRISPQAAALLQYYPLPDPNAGGAYNYQIPALSTRRADTFNGSIPNVFNNNTNLIGFTAGYNRSTNESTSLFGFDTASRGNGINVGLNWTRRFLPSNQQVRFRHTYTRQTNTAEPFFAGVRNVSGEAGITGNDQSPENWGPPSLSFASGIAGLSDSQYSSNRTQSHALNVETSKAMGRNTMTIGGNARYQMLDIVSQQNARGSFSFTGAYSGHDFADFLLGIPNTSAIAYGNADKGFRAWTYDAYWNNDFRLSPSMTLNMGLRWEYEAPVSEHRGRLVNLDVAPDFSAAAPVIAADGIGPITGRRYPDSLVKSDPFGIQPRFGVAWRPVVTSSVVLRAGYGIYRNTSVYQTFAQQMAQQPPLSFTFNSTNTPETPLTLANGFIAPLATTLNTAAFDPEFKVGTVHRWQASAQRDFPGGLTATATYLAGRGVNLPQAFIPNTYPTGAPNPCPTCPAGFVYYTSGATSLQNAGQFQLRRRLSAGLTWTATYTLTRARDNASSFGGIGGVIAQDWRNLDAEYGPSSFEQPHQFTLQATYSTGQSVAGGAMVTGLRGTLLKGWTLTSNLTTGSGLPRTPTYLVTSVAGVTGTVRANLTGAPIDEAPDGYYVNPAAFAAPAPGTWGDAPRNSIRGPRQYSLNAGLSRAFPVRGRINLNWSLNATNLLNRVTYSNINTVVGSPQFGLPTATNSMRRITMSVRTGF